jgi:hypothetical protein
MRTNSLYLAIKSEYIKNVQKQTEGGMFLEKVRFNEFFYFILFYCRLLKLELK